MTDWSQSAYDAAHEDMGTQPAGGTVQPCPRVAWDAAIESVPPPAWESTLEVVPQDESSAARAEGADAQDDSGPGGTDAEPG